LNYLSITFLVLFLYGCASNEKQVLPKESKPEPQKQEIVADLVNIPQNPSFYTKSITPLKGLSVDAFEKAYFRVWNTPESHISLDDAMWADKLYSQKNSYGENLQPRSKKFFEKIKDNSHYSAYKTINKRALSLKHLDIRAMPSDEVVLMDPRKAGEGFPFDYLQNSSIAANKPLLLSHYSKDKKWAFVESSFTYGWVKSRDIVTLDKKYTDLWQKAQQVVITKEGVPIESKEGKFLFKSRIGMMFAIINEDKTSYTILTVGKYRENKPLFLESRISKEIAHKGFLKFTAENITMILKQLKQNQYGWGGMFGQRDCSSTMRDFFMPFGLWLPRNSYQQSLSGKRVILTGLTRDEKITIIKKEATPFKTLIYKQGHIGLYAGEFNGKIVFFQNVWGVKTKKDGVEGRFVIGKPIFSSLEVGSNLKDFDENATMLSQLKSITKL